MWLFEVGNILDVLVEGPLEPVLNTERGWWNNEEDIPLPIVKIGRPTVQHHRTADDLTGDFKPTFDQHRFDTIRLPFNLDIPDQRVKIEKVRLSVNFIGDPLAPDVYDASPFRQYEDLGKQSYGVKIGPNLKFRTVDVTGAELKYEVERPKQIPVAVTKGLGTDTIVWEFRRAPNYILEGDFVVFMTTQAVHACRSSLAYVDLTADVICGAKDLKTFLNPDSHKVKGKSQFLVF